MRDPVPSYKDIHDAEGFGVLERMMPLGTLPTEREKHGKKNAMRKGRSSRQSRGVSVQSGVVSNRLNGLAVLGNGNGSITPMEDGAGSETPIGSSMMLDEIEEGGAVDSGVETPLNPNPEEEDSDFGPADVGPTTLGRPRRSLIQQNLEVSSGPSLKAIMEAALAECVLKGNDDIGNRLRSIWQQASSNAETTSLLNSVAHSKLNKRQTKAFQKLVKSQARDTTSLLSQFPTEPTRGTQQAIDRVFDQNASASAASGGRLSSLPVDSGDYSSSLPQTPEPDTPADSDNERTLPFLNRHATVAEAVEAAAKAVASGMPRPTSAQSMSSALSSAPSDVEDLAAGPTSSATRSRRSAAAAAILTPKAAAAVSAKAGMKGKATTSKGKGQSSTPTLPRSSFPQGHCESKRKIEEEFTTYNERALTFKKRRMGSAAVDVRTGDAPESDVRPGVQARPELTPELSAEVVPKEHKNPAPSKIITLKIGKKRSLEDANNASASATVAVAEGEESGEDDAGRPSKAAKKGYLDV